MTVPRRAPAAAFSGIIAVNLHMRCPRRQPRSGVPGVVATLHCSWCNRATAVVCRLGLDELRHDSELLGRAYTAAALSFFFCIHTEIARACAYF